ncbi:hypothetical protein EYF80_050032 [Liparis tanakae]|uniref:Uncharacterized protein n=1 Tax=Liparis tanakae TaxID=230148 RepID=A0A4Z2FFT4_9TELE|nr:hypothetical protein EYF80_050032 [Liparis tanakae]
MAQLDNGDIEICITVHSWREEEEEEEESGKRSGPGEEELALLALAGRGREESGRSVTDGGHRESVSISHTAAGLGRRETERHRSAVGVTEAAEEEVFRSFTRRTFTSISTLYIFSKRLKNNVSKCH